MKKFAACLSLTVLSFIGCQTQDCQPTKKKRCSEVSQEASQLDAPAEQTADASTTAE